MSYERYTPYWSQCVNDGLQVSWNYSFDLMKKIQAEMPFFTILTTRLHYVTVGEQNYPFTTRNEIFKVITDIENPEEIDNNIVQTIKGKFEHDYEYENPENFVLALGSFVITKEFISANINFIRISDTPVSGD